MYIYIYMLCLSCRFLAAFQDNKGLGKESLKFTKSFNMGIEHEDIIRVGTNEDMFLASDILAKAGTPWDTFPDAPAAIAAVRHLAKKNAVEHGHDVQEDVDEEYPQFSRFWMVYGKGKDRMSEQVTSKKLEQTAPLATLQQLETAKHAMEIVGFQENATLDGQASIENANAEQLKKLVELLKLA